MSDAVVFLAAPLAMCLLLAGIHCYLGLHVLARGVIFVDLSLAQVASFGAAVALMFDPEHSSPTGDAISLACTLVAAFVFALARRHEKTFPQEALIGIVYALASAALVLVVDRLAHGAEHLKEALVGQLLWITWTDVLKTSAVYAAVAAVHYVFRRKLIESSFAKGPTPIVWDFLFYALFGVVITSSTSIAGVLLVFAYLIVPSLLATAFFRTMRARLLFGWGLGAALSFAGVALSYAWDVPVGALIVVLFTLLPLLILPFLRRAAKAPSRE